MDYILFEKFARQVRNQARAAKKYKNEVKQWLTVAVDDLEISELLYAQKHYAGAIYHLQQFYEKITKAYFILMGRATPDEIKGHSFNITELRDMIKDNTINNAIALMKNVDEDNKYVSSIIVKEEVFDIVNKKEDDIRLLNQEGFDELLAVINKFEEVLSNPQFLISVEKKIRIHRFQKRLRHIIYMITHFRVSYKQVDEIVSEHNIKNYLDSCAISIRLLILGLFTFLHYNTPRYPYDKYSSVNYFHYTTSLGIVQKYSVLVEQGKEILKHLQADVERTNN